MIFKICLFHSFIFINFSLAAGVEKCLEFPANSTDYCLLCSQDYYSLKESASGGDPFPIEECLKKNSTLFELEIFVSDKTCLASSPCDGSQEYPFDNLVYALDVINNRTKMYSNSNVHLYLLGEEIFVLERDLKNAIMYYFIRTLISITISPLFCSVKMGFACKSDEENIKIIMKTNNFFFFVNMFLKISNIVFIGSDMPLEINFNSSSCYYDRRICCDPELRQIPLIQCSLNSFDEYKYFKRGTRIFGFLNIEYTKSSVNLSAPQIYIENSEFKSIITLFPNDLPRFSSLFFINGIAASINLKNVHFYNCSLAEGIIKQTASAGPEILIGSYVSIINSSIINYNSNNRNQSSSSMIFFENFPGEINMNIIYVAHSSNPKVRFFSCLNVSSSIKLSKIYFRSNEDIGFVLCALSKLLVLEDISFMQSRFADSLVGSFFDIKYSDKLYVSNLFIKELYFGKGKNLNTFALANIFKALEFSNAYFENVEGLYIGVESSFLKFKSLVSINLTADNKLISTRNCSISLEGTLFSYIYIYGESLIYLESLTTGSNYSVQVFDGHFSNVLFFYYHFDKGVIEWHFCTNSDMLLMNNVSIFNCTEGQFTSYVTFFYAYLFNKIEFINIDFSYFTKGFNSLLFLLEVKEVLMMNCSFRNIDYVDYYLIQISCTSCLVSFANVKVENVSFTLECFLFSGKIEGIYENVTFTEIHNILPSIFFKFPHSFYYGLIIFASHQNCKLKNWLLRSSESYKFTPSKFFYFLYNSFVILDNINMYLSQSNSVPPETIVLISNYDYNIFINQLSVKNFHCQTSIPGNFFFEGGLVSFHNSLSFLKEDFFECLVVLKNISIENCKFCLNGVVGFVNVYQVIITNLSITRSDSINGGAVAFYYGNDVLIDNLKASITSALNYGGAIFTMGSISIVIKNSLVYEANAIFGGSLYLKDVKNLSLDNLKCIRSRALLDGGILYSANSNFTINKLNAVDYHAIRDGGCIFIRKGNIESFDAFRGTNCFAEKGSFLFSSNSNKINISDILITNCSTLEKGVSFFIEDCSFLEVVDMTLNDITSESGFGNLFLLIRSKPASYSLNNLAVIRNNMLSSLLVYIENEIHYSTINFNVKISNVFISGGAGTIAFVKSSYFFKNHAFVLFNITVFGLYSSTSSNKNEADNLLNFEKTYAKVQTIVFQNVIVNVDGFSVFDGEIDCESVTFLASAKSSKLTKTQFFFRVFNSSATIDGIIYFGNSETAMAVVYSEGSHLVINNSIVSKCQTYYTSCIESYKSSVIISSSSFFDNRGYGSGAVNLKNSSFLFERSNFLANSAINYVKVSLQSSANKLANNLIVLGLMEGLVSVISQCFFLVTGQETSAVIDSSAVKVFSTLFSVTGSSNQQRSKALFCLNSDIDILGSKFSNFYSDNGGTIRIEQRLNTLIRRFSLENSIISNSSSDYGGAFSLFGNLEIFISECSFYKNSAYKNQSNNFGYFGVGIFICTYCEISSFFLINNAFLNNYAENGLATLFSNSKIYTSTSTNQPKLNNYQSPNIDTNFYFNNTDGINFKCNISFMPLTKKFFITLENGIKQSDFDINNVLYFRSGQAFGFSFELQDGLGQRFLLDHQSNTELIDRIKSNLSLLLIGNNLDFSDRGEFNLKNLIINADLYRSFVLQLVINFNLDYLYPEDRTSIVQGPLNVTLFSKPCELGEIIIEEDSSCLKCPSGKYSLADSMKEYNASKSYSLKCLVCPTNAYCSGGTAITPQKGFWRYSNSSAWIVECLSKNSCLGYDDGKELTEQELINGRCLSHSSGPLCYICEPGYGRFSKKGICKICSSEIESYIKLSVIIVAFLMYSVIQIKLNFQNNEKSSTEALLKIIVTHAQQLNLISLVDLGWTTEFKAFFSLQDVFSFLTEDLLPLECFLQKLGFNIYTQKVIATNIYPIVLSMLVPVCWIIFLVITTSKASFSKTKMLQIIHVTFLIVIVSLFPEIISKCLSLFTCLKVDETGTVKLLLYSPEVICWSEEHKTYLIYAAAPGLILWGLIAPFIIAYFLFKNRFIIIAVLEEENKLGHDTLDFRLHSLSKLHSNTIRAQQLEKVIQLKFLFKGYSSQYFYWELFVFLKKFVLISIGCISDLLPSNLKGIILLLVISLFLYIQIRFRPLESSTLNNLDFFSLSTLFFTTYVGILLFTDDFKSWSLPLLIFIFTIHGLFLLFWSYLFLKEVLAKNIILKIIGAISNKLRKKKRVMPQACVVSSQKTKFQTCKL